MGGARQIQIQEASHYRLLQRSFDLLPVPSFQKPPEGHGGFGLGGASTQQFAPKLTFVHLTVRERGESGFGSRPAMTTATGRRVQSAAAHS